MSTGGGTTTQTTQQKADPWGPAQPYLRDVMQQAQSLYQSQQGQNQYAPFQTVVSPSAETQQGLDLTAQRALAGSPVTRAAQGSVTGVLNGSSPGMSTLQSLTGGYADSGQAVAQRVASGAAPGQNVLMNWADPNNINPYLTSQYQAASRPVIDSINAQFSQAGRTGSAANQDVLTRNLGDLSANIFSAGYDNAANRSLSAANSMIGNQLTAAGQLSTNAANQANVRGNAANNLNSSTLNAAQLAPTLAGQDYVDLQNLLNVGGAKDAQSQAQIQDMLNRWNYGNQQPWNILQQYGGAVSGLGALMPGSSSSTGTTTTPGQSIIPSLLGGAVSLATAPLGGSLFGKLFQD